MSTQEKYWYSFLLLHIIRSCSFTFQSKEDNSYLHFYSFPECHWFTKGVHKHGNKNKNKAKESTKLYRQDLNAEEDYFFEIC